MNDSKSHATSGSTAGRIGRWLAPLCVIALGLTAAGCSPTYRVTVGEDATVLRIGWPALLFDAGLVLALVLIGVFYHPLRHRITGVEEDEPIAVVRIFAFVAAGVFTLARLYPHLMFAVRVDDEGVYYRSIRKETAIPWEEAVAVRNNRRWRDETDPYAKPTARLEIVGARNDVIYLRRDEIGRKNYERFADAVGEHYFEREKLTEGSVLPQPAEPPEIKPLGVPEPGSPSPEPASEDLGQGGS